VLKSVFNEIDKLEKTRLDVKNFSHTEDNYLPWAILLFILVAADMTIRYTILRKIP
jgi:Ca-activated chloride channel family protein